MTQPSHTPSAPSLQETLSALADNQAQPLEVLRLLKAMEQDPTLIQHWQRYQLTGHTLRGHCPSTPQLRLDIAIAQAIAQEAPHSATKAALAPWRTLITKSAVAASVALAIVFSARQFTAPEAPATLAVAANAPATLASAPHLPAPTPVATLNSVTPIQEAPAGFTLPQPDARIVSNKGEVIRHSLPMGSSLPVQNWRNDAALQQELNQLLIDHAARSSGNGSLGLLPFARVSTLKPAAAPQD